MNTRWINFDELDLLQEMMTLDIPNLVQNQISLMVWRKKDYMNKRTVNSNKRDILT